MTMTKAFLIPVSRAPDRVNRNTVFLVSDSSAPAAPNQMPNISSEPSNVFEPSPLYINETFSSHTPVMSNILTKTRRWLAERYALSTKSSCSVIPHFLTTIGARFYSSMLGKLSLPCAVASRCSLDGDVAPIAPGVPLMLPLSWTLSPNSL